MIREEIGALLWRRYYSARVSGGCRVSMLPETLKDLLEQAGVAEPDDDVVFGPQGLWHGKTMNSAKN